MLRVLWHGMIGTSWRTGGSMVIVADILIFRPLRILFRNNSTKLVYEQITFVSVYFFFRAIFPITLRRCNTHVR